LPPARFAVSIYQTNSAEECHYVLHHSGARAVFVEDAEQLAKVRAVQADLPALEFVVVIEPADADGSTVSLDALRERGQGRSVPGRAPGARRRRRAGHGEPVGLHVGHDRGRRRRAS